MPHDVPTLSPGPSEQQLVAPPSEAERSRERAELIASVAADLNGGVDLGAVLGTAVRRAAELLGVEDASVWLLDAAGQELCRTAEREAHGGRDALPLRYLPG